METDIDAISMLVEVDRACPETLPHSLRSPWYHFLSQSYNYFLYTSAILEFLGKEMLGKVDIYTSKNVTPKT